MEIFLSAVLGELTARSMSFIISKYSTPPLVQAVEMNLERVLLRAQVIIDEAEGRHVTNQGMLQQLSMLRDAMYQGFYVLDTLRYRAFEEDGLGGNEVHNHSWALSKFSCAKRLCLSSSTSSSTKESQELVAENVLDSLRILILDASVSVMLLTTYPRFHRQPYNMHILLGNCMFGRQMEKEMILHFLLSTQPSCSRLDKFDVLPVIGPANCGKSTLVAHVCNDERVRNHFSQIDFFRHGIFRDEDISVLTDRCTVRDEQNRKVLIVFEIVGDLNDDLWERLYSLSRKCAAGGSKIIITSRSDKITKLGTTQPMTLKHLPKEALWYFFKVVTFGGMDPKMHPRLAYVAMEIAKLLDGSLIAANVIGGVLRTNFTIQYWCKILKFMSEGANCHLLTEDKPGFLRRLGRTTADVFISSKYQTCSTQEELPEIRVQDVLYGDVKPQGTFKALTWNSPLPPYGCYIHICEIQQPKTKLVKKRRSPNNISIRRG
ncbi:unnamed protein product [Alopecurus aequalis]